MTPIPVTVMLPDALIDAIAERVVNLLDEREHGRPASPWLDVEEAAAYLRASKQRIYDLVSAGELNPARDGRRLLFRREQLDALITGDET